MEQTTQNSRIIKASAEVVYRAFTDPAALESWLAPGEMKGKVHHFDFSIGGGYKMSLFYPEDGQKSKGKTSENEDRFTARYVELVPNRKIVQAVNFESRDPGFSGEMIMEVMLASVDGGTLVTFHFRDIPPASDQRTTRQAPSQRLINSRGLSSDHLGNNISGR